MGCKLRCSIYFLACARLRLYRLFYWGCFHLVLNHKALLRKLKDNKCDVFRSSIFFIGWSIIQVVSKPTTSFGSSWYQSVNCNLGVKILLITQYTQFNIKSKLIVDERLYYFVLISYLFIYLFFIFLQRFDHDDQYGNDFLGKRQLTAFLSWLDYVNQLSIEAHPVKIS